MLLNDNNNNNNVGFVRYKNSNPDLQWKDSYSHII